MAARAMKNQNRKGESAVKGKEGTVNEPNMKIQKKRKGC